jgi:hypothetical protein
MAGVGLVSAWGRKLRVSHSTRARDEKAELAWLDCFIDSCPSRS